jgi:membrane protease YdiL (CAAX protease family)
MISIFILLALAVCAVWMKEVKISRYSFPLWIIFLIAAGISGLIQNYLEIKAVLWIAFFGLVTYYRSKTTQHRFFHALHLFLIAGMAFALAVGQFSGFHNPAIVTDLAFSAEGKTFSHYLHINKIAVGVILAAAFCNPVKTWREWSAILRKTVPIIFTTLIVIFSFGVLVNYVSVDLKWMPYTLVFLISNLLFTCVAEESFFRGALQGHIAQLAARWKIGALISIALPALLFGIAHIRGGVLYVGLATTAGIFYGYAKYRVQRIEAAILTHFAVNAVHFTAFTYPNF